MSQGSEQRPGLVAAMLDPDFYPDPPGSVELRETHISWVVLAGEFAYKVKKSLTLPFLDYGTPERRHDLCREEVRLNRRWAPEIYLGVVGLACDGGRWSLVAEDDPHASEHAVWMRRIDESHSMASLATEGALEHRHVVEVARRLSQIHADAPIVMDGHRSVELLEATLEENTTTLSTAGDAILDGRRIEAARVFTEASLAARRDHLEVRARNGSVRDCHGDLRAEHVIIPERGDIYLFDGIEFDPGLRRIDVATDLAFLVMDLAALGHEDLALTLVEAYRDAGGDPGDDATLSFFAAYRAWVRAKVACLRALELRSGPERSAQEAQARELLTLGHRFAWRTRRPLIVVVCGVAASGKTTLAQQLASVSGWDHVSSDIVRKRLAGVAPEERAGSEHYSAEFTLRTYGELGLAAREAFGASGGVIVDATFHRRDERAAFFAALGTDRESTFFVECRAPRSVLLGRARKRELEPGRVSDADSEVVRAQLAAFEPLDEVAEEARIVLSTERPPSELLAAVERAIDNPARRPAGEAGSPISPR